MALSLTKALASIALLHAPMHAKASSLSSPPLSSTNGQEWVSLSKNVEFLPVTMTSSSAENPNNLDSALEDAASSLRRAQERVLSTYSSQTFAEGASDTQYSAYATAWRLLGVYIDCSTSAADAQQQRQRRRRDRRHRGLEENADENEDEANDDGGQQQQQEQNYASTSCPRYLLWEAVRDRDHECISWGG
jgi:hypothetical protein